MFDVRNLRISAVFPYGTPPVAQPMSQQSTMSQPVPAQQSVEKRKRNAIKIVDPSTGLEVSTDDLTKTSSASHTPSSLSADAASVSRRDAISFCRSRDVCLACLCNSVFSALTLNGNIVVLLIILLFTALSLLIVIACMPGDAMQC